VLDDKTIGFADFSGNRQYVTVGNLLKDDRVSLFLMDYANRTRLKILGKPKSSMSATCLIDWPPDEVERVVATLRQRIFELEEMLQVAD
jgi:hypothetical protein